MDRYLVPIGVKICVMVAVCLSCMWVSLLLVAISLGSPNRLGGQKCFFGQFVFDLASLACVVNSGQLMHGHAIHRWILFIVPTWSSAYVG